MLTFFLFIIVVCIGMYLLSYIPASIVHESRTKLNESQIVKRFNKILRGLKDRNLDAVKLELTECLDQFAMVKEQQFSFTLAQIRKSYEEICRQTNQVELLVSRAKRDLEVFRSRYIGHSTEQAVAEGAKLLYKLKTNETIVEKLYKSKQDLENREAELNNMLMDFNSNLAVKKAEIAIMVADSTGIFSGSDVDLRLDNLVKEFQGKIIEGKAAQEVHEKLSNNEDTNNKINYASCVEEVKKLLG